MRWYNFLGFAMLFFALFFNELFLGMNTWYEVNFGAVIVAIVYMTVAVALSLWTSLSPQHA